jgi:hypothetical protein
MDTVSIEIVVIPGRRIRVLRIGIIPIKAPVNFHEL